MITVKNQIWMIVLIAMSIGVAFVILPRKVDVVDSPETIIYHDRNKKDVVRINLKEGDPISEEIANFLQMNTTGWRIIIKSLSLGETAPSIEIFGADNSYDMGVWQDEVVLGFMKPEKSYRKKLTPEFHARLVDLINKTESN